MSLLFCTNRVNVKRSFATHRLLSADDALPHDAMMDTRQIVGQRLATARKRLGLTLRDICERVPGMTESKLGNYERGYRMPDIDTFRQLGKALETSAAYLTTLQDDALSDRERELLACFRRLNAQQQQTILSVCNAFDEPHSLPADVVALDGVERRKPAIPRHKSMRDSLMDDLSLGG